MPVISFMLANYAARPLNWQAQSWAQAEAATSAYFAPLETFTPRFEEYLREAAALGFSAVDLWQPMLDYRWITDDHLDAAADLLDAYGLQTVSFAGWLGANEDEFEANCEIAAALGVDLLTGGTSADHAFISAALAKYGLRWGYENEGERTPDEILARIGDDPAIGVCADVGWFATHDIDAAAAIRQLAPRLFHVHLKDIQQAGSHETCRFGEGIVPLEAVLHALEALQYAGALSIEHETAPDDPSGEIRASLAQLHRWLEG